jgi:hypothetical protein
VRQRFEVSRSPFASAAIIAFDASMRGLNAT